MHPYVCLCVLMGPYRSLCVSIGLYGSSEVFTRPYESIWVLMDL